MLDGAVALLDANAGVEPQTETVWRQADKYNVPRMIFINKMDKIGASFYNSVQSVKDRLGGNALEMQLPIGSEDQFKGVVDLVKNVAYIYPDDADLGVKYDTVEIPEDMKEKAEEYRDRPHRGRRRDGRRRHGEIFRRRNARRRDDPALVRGHHRQQGRARLLWHRVQEQGRSAPARRRRGLSAEPARHPPSRASMPRPAKRRRVRRRTTSRSPCWPSRS